MAEKDIVERLREPLTVDTTNIMSLAPVLRRLLVERAEAADLIDRLRAREPEGWREFLREVQYFWGEDFPDGPDGPCAVTDRYRAAYKRLLAMLASSPEPSSAAGWTLVPNELVVAAQEFVAKVDRGEARSQRSYGAFKAALDRLSPPAQGA